MRHNVVDHLDCGETDKHAAARRWPALQLAKHAVTLLQKGLYDPWAHSARCDVSSAVGCLALQVRLHACMFVCLPRCARISLLPSRNRRQPMQALRKWEGNYAKLPQRQSTVQVHNAYSTIYHTKFFTYDAVQLPAAMMNQIQANL